MKTKRLFDLLVVGGGLWIVGCGAAVTETQGQVDQNVPAQTDGGTPSATGTDPGGGGSKFW